MIIRREVVVFDPANALHRQYFANFVVNHRWGDCPVVFETRPVAGNKVAAMTALVAEYYLKNEFTTEGSK